jgi:hypothetical protein
LAILRNAVSGRHNCRAEHCTRWLAPLEALLKELALDEIARVY